MPRGRSRLPPGQVVDAQRLRLTRAVIAVVASEGYAGTSVAQIVATARVSKAAFYQNFSGKEECFLAGCLAGLHIMLVSIGESLERVEPGDDVGRLRASIAGFLGFLAAHPEFARCFAEMPSAGGEARRRFLGVVDLLAVNTRRWHQRLVGESGLSPESTYRMLSGGMAHLCLVHIQENRTGRLPDLVDDLFAAHLRLLAVPERGQPAS